MSTGISKFIRLVLTIIGLALLYACGGGGGDDPPLPPPPIVQYTVSGTVHPAAGSAIDSDVNDPEAPYQANDSIATAQPIPNPVTLGGYLNQPGAGPAGRSHGSGDLADVYQVSLLAGQQINLLIAGDGVRNDLDLELADRNGRLVDAAISQRRVESLTVKASGDYLVRVTVHSGASNYLLTIGQAQLSSSPGLRLSDEFIPGEVILRFQDSAAARPDGLRAQAQTLGLMTSGQQEIRERNHRFNFSQLQSLGVYRAVAGATSSDPSDEFQPADAVQRDKLETLRQVRALAQNPDVAAAAPNYLRQIQFSPNDPLYRYQWHYPQINLPQAWDLTTGAGAIVAVIDTGIVLSHPDLQGQWVAGYDFISNPANALDGDGIDRDPSDPGDRSNPDGSSSFHGTHVAGTVAAATNNGIGVAGVAFGAKVMPLRAVGQLGGSIYDIEQAVRFAAGLPNDSGTVPPRRADVINLSLGSTYFDSEDQAVFDLARAAGVVVVAAAGNSANSTRFYPAAYPGVLAVSAVDINKNLAPYSSFGAWISVAAPGGSTAQDVNGDGKPDGVLSTVATDTGGVLVNDYVIWQGTSMATPHVAGVVALMKALAPQLTPADAANLLAAGALTDDIGVAGRDDQFGYGLINGYKAAIAAINSGGQPVDPTPILAVNPTALNFGISLSSQTLSVLNGGGGNLTVSPPTVDAGWLSATPTQVDAGGLGIYTVSVNRTGLADGVYNANLTFKSSAGTFQVKVIMQVANSSGYSTVGRQYALLLDPDTGETVAEGMMQAQTDGGYAFTMHDVPKGVYQLYAGADSNNDRNICSVGESCGAYLTLDKPLLVTVDRDRSGLDFVSGFLVNLTDFQSAVNPQPIAALTRITPRRLESVH